MRAVYSIEAKVSWFVKAQRDKIFPVISRFDTFSIQSFLYQATPVLITAEAQGPCLMSSMSKT